MIFIFSKRLKNKTKQSKNPKYIFSKENKRQLQLQLQQLLILQQLQLQQLQLQPQSQPLQLHYTALHYNYHYHYNYSYKYISTTIATPLRCLQLLVGPSVHSLCDPSFTATNLSYRFPIFETSATALCGTTGIT